MLDLLTSLKYYSMHGYHQFVVPIYYILV